MRTSRLKQGYTLLVMSLLTSLLLIYSGIGLEILVLFGPTTLLVIIALLAACFLALVLIAGLPILIAKIALWPTKWPTYDEPSSPHGTATVSVNDAPPAPAIPLLDARRLFPLTVPRILVYAAMVTAILALFILASRHTRPGTIPDIQIFTTCGAEMVFFAVLFARVLTRRRRVALRSS